MNRFLIIDDDIKRSETVANKISIELSISIDQIDKVVSLNDGKRLLRSTFYTALFLDMALPTKRGEKPHPNAGVSLLDALERDRYKTPNRIIGYTAIKEDVTDMEARFENIGFKLYSCKSGDFSWLDSALKQVGYAIRSVNSYDVKERDIAVVTVHGILTFGDWQDGLFDVIKQKRPDLKVSDLSFKFARIDLFTFLVPGLRTVVVNKFHTDFLEWITNNRTKRIVCFSHSFGTYVLESSLKRIELTQPELLDSLDLVVFSGSILKQNTDLSYLKRRNNIRIVNECAVHDIPLLFSEAFVLGGGMAGRLGFSAICTDKFRNRYFKGGHSSFFDKNMFFVKEKWIPLIFEKDIAVENNIGEYNLVSKIIENLARLSGRVKWVYYFLIVFYCFMIFDFSILDIY